MGNKIWTYEDEQFLTKNIKTSNEKMSKLLNRTIQAIASKKLKIGANKRDKYPFIYLSDRQKQIFDGLVISDACIRLPRKYSNQHPSFSLTSIHNSFIEDVKYKIPLRWSKTYVRLANSQKNRNNKTSYTILTNNNYTTELSTEYKRWYNNYIKIIPQDLKISPILLKYWFYGDGCSRRNRKYPKNIEIRLATNNFTHLECIYLQELLKKEGMPFNISRWKPKIETLKNKDRGYLLYISRQGLVMQFFEYIGQCDVSCFLYKWKLP